MFCSSSTKGIAKRLLLAAVTIATPARSQHTCEAPRDVRIRLIGKPADAAANELGAWFAQKGDLTCAIQSFENAVKANPDSLDGRYNLGLALTEAGNSARAARELQILARREPNVARVHAALGLALRGSGDLSGAESELRKALVLDDKN